MQSTLRLGSSCFTATVGACCATCHVHRAPHTPHSPLLTTEMKSPFSSLTLSGGSTNELSTSATSCAPCHLRGLLRRTRLLHARKILSPEEARAALLGRSWTKDGLAGASAMEVNLLEDPTAGLAAGPAEELTSTELETRVRVLVSSYTPALYRLLYTPFIDVIGVLVREKLVPDAGNVKQMSSTASTAGASMTGGGGAAGSGSHVIPGVADSYTNTSANGHLHSSSGSDGASRPIVSTTHRPVRPEEIISRWFTDGASTLKHPHETAEAMGKRRWSALCRGLEAHWAGMEDVMPLTRVVRQHHLREDLYLPLLRQLAMELADPTKRAAAVETLPGFILSLANGRAPRSLGLPEKDEDRIRLVSNLFLGVAQETGDTDLAYLALQLLRANNMETPFAAQKQLTNVFSTASRIETDWQMRGSSLLTECYKKWLDYLRQVQKDNKVALEQLHAAEAQADDKDVLQAEAEEDRRGDTVKEQHRKRAEHDSPARTAGQEETAAAADALVRGASKKRNSHDNSDHNSSVEPEHDGGVDSTEQYRYFTSRRQDDVSRITALEANITAALRSRAAELEGVRPRGWRKRLEAEKRALQLANKQSSATMSDVDASAAKTEDGEAAEADENDEGEKREHYYVQPRSTHKDAARGAKGADEIAESTVVSKSQEMFSRHKKAAAPRHAHQTASRDRRPRNSEAKIKGRHNADVADEADSTDLQAKTTTRDAATKATAASGKPAGRKKLKNAAKAKHTESDNVKHVLMF